MGKSYTPTYRVEYTDNLLLMRITAPDSISNVDHKPVHSMIWKGKPSEKKLEQWRRDYNQSFQPGGSNAHIGETFGAIPHINWARIVHQASRTVVAEVKMPTFEVV